MRISTLIKLFNLPTGTVALGSDLVFSKPQIIKEVCSRQGRSFADHRVAKPSIKMYHNL